MAKRRHILPGFRLTLGFTLVYTGLLVLLPFAALAARALTGTWGHLWDTVTDARVLAAFRLSFGASLVAALINGFFGLLMAWALTRYEFPGRRIADAIVDLPFALPTAVAGIALTALYAPTGWIGRWFAPWDESVRAWAAASPWGGPVTAYLTEFGIGTAFTPVGVTIALTFIGLPFVVRTLQPVVQDLHLDVEEAAACLGANRWQTFWRVVLPGILPAWLTGVTLAFGRAVGEYGSVVFISGNLPFKTEIAPLLIVAKLEQYDYSGAAAIGFTMLLASLVIVVAVNVLQLWHARRIA